VAWFFEGVSGIVPDRRGLAEDAPGFAFDGPEELPARASGADATFSRETLELVRAFNRIADPQVRRRLSDLVKSLATLSGRAAGGDGDA
jgi:hypothetical protein